MDFTKKINLKNIFVFLFLVLFPFGQIIRMGILQPLDVVAALGALYTFLSNQKKPWYFKYISYFLAIVIASWAFSYFIFGNSIFYGFLYLLRLLTYSYFAIYVWNFAQVKGNKELLINSLIGISLIAAAFGWIQFFIFPDLKPLFIWNWDMHLYRLVGTFFDPAFLGLIIVFGLLIVITIFFETKKKLYFIFSIFLLLSLAFTYSRASYLAFFAGLLVIALHKKLYKQILLFIVFLSVLVFILPTAKNHSIELFRTVSAIARVENYQNTIKIFTHSPIFGVGYDNMCIAYQKFIGYQKFESHACSGSDSSLLFVLATTGVPGLLIFIFAFGQIIKNMQGIKYPPLIKSTVAALLVHSVFSNSIFYPWIIGWIFILFAEV